MQLRLNTTQHRTWKQTSNYGRQILASHRFLMVFRITHAIGNANKNRIHPKNSPSNPVLILSTHLLEPRIEVRNRIKPMQKKLPYKTSSMVVRFGHSFRNPMDMLASRITPTMKSSTLTSIIKESLRLLRRLAIRNIVQCIYENYPRLDHVGGNIHF